MRYLIWLLRAVLFILLLGFAIKNDGPVTVRFFLGAEWQVPLVIVMLLMFAAGVALGATTALATLFSQRREIQRLKRNTERRSKPRVGPSTELPDAL